MTLRRARSSRDFRAARIRASRWTLALSAELSANAMVEIAATRHRNVLERIILWTQEIELRFPKKLAYIL
jgi:hypothetical protein